MPSLIVYTNPLTVGICQLPVFAAGDDQNWSLQFNNGTMFYNPTGVSMRLGFINGLADGTYATPFEWVDRQNNRHIPTAIVLASAVPSISGWDDAPIGVQGGNGAFLLSGRFGSQSVRKIFVLSGGSGLSTAPAMRCAGGNSQTGQGCTGTATIAGADVSAITLTNCGFGYSSSNPPDVIITGDGTGAVWKVSTVTAGKIVDFTKVKAGSGYTTATVRIVDPEATATASVAGSAALSALILGNGGSGYTSAPTVAITGGGGSSGTATAAIAAASWGIGTVTITAQGTGFTSAPAVAFSGGGGSGAAGTAIIIGKDIVASATITNQGRYSVGASPVPITFSGGGGSGAAGYATTAYSPGLGCWVINAIFITAGGTGYTTAPTIAFTYPVSGAEIVAATATAVLGTGKVGSITITNPGTGYTSNPTVAITGGGGSGATATAAVTGSPVISLTITAAGSGYTSAPAVGFSGGGGGGAVATAILNLGISAVTMVQPGFGYTSAPSIYTEPAADAVFQVGGIDANPVPYVRNFSPISAQPAITATPFSFGRRDSSGNLVYDNSLLLIRPRQLLLPTLTLQPDNLTWSGVFTPVVTWVTAVLGFRRSVTVDVEIFGAGRLLFLGSLTILAA